MTNFKHLTQFELSAYHNDSLERAERHAIGKHLLTCSECRKLLPLPSVEKFWSAIMIENERDDKPENKRLKVSFFSIAASFRNLPSNLVWSSGALMILIGLSLVIWLSLVDQPTKERDMTRSFESDTFINPPNKIKDQMLLPPRVLPSENINAPQPDSGREKVAHNQKPSELDRRRMTSDSRNDFGKNLRKKVNGENKKIISTTRGAADEKCSEAAVVLMATENSDQTVQLRWKKIPNAVKYHLYVSDDNEILVDEYETDRENVYFLKKPLDPVKTYKWKIVITLENGQTIVGDAQKFTIKDLRLDQEITKGQKKVQTRCSAGK